MSMIGELCTEGWERNLPRTGRQVAEAIAAQRDAERDYAAGTVKLGDERLAYGAVARAAYEVRYHALRRARALQCRAEGYAVHFALDWAMDCNRGAGSEPTNENIAIVLRSCARAPRPEEYPAIRDAVGRYRRGELEL